MKSPNLTAHMLVQNEDIFVWYAIQSILPHVEQILITDNGSTDHTLEIINSIKSPKIKLKKYSPTDREGLVERRREHIKMTKTDWFFLIDGDEIWPEKNLNYMIQLIKESDKSIKAFACRTRNCVGDIYHYQPEAAGNYQILDQKGHLTVRFFRNEDIKLTGEYPLEAFTFNDLPIQNQTNHLKFADTWYLHTTHLPRSSSTLANAQVIDRLKKYKLEIGKSMSKAELPQILFDSSKPIITPDPLQIKYTPLQTLIAYVLTPLKTLKRQL